MHTFNHHSRYIFTYTHFFCTLIVSVIAISLIQQYRISGLTWLHIKSSSTVQFSEQPSKAIVLLSSHASTPSNTPLPHSAGCAAVGQERRTALKLISPPFSSITYYRDLQNLCRVSLVPRPPHNFRHLQYEKALPLFFGESLGMRLMQSNFFQKKQRQVQCVL